MTRKKERFNELIQRCTHVSLWSNGRDRAHLGNARNVIMFDVSFLRHIYGEKAVNYVRNFTDVHKINDRARQSDAALQKSPKRQRNGIWRMGPWKFNLPICRAPRNTSHKWCR